MNSKCLLVISSLFLLFVINFQGVDSQQCSKRSEIVFVVDQSGSIRDANPSNGSWDNWSLMKDFISEIIRSADIGYNGVHCGLVTFGNIGVVRFRLLDNLDQTSLLAAVRAVPPGNGQTNLYAGLNLACNDILSIANNARPDVPHIIIVLTDGKANRDVEMTLPQATACQEAGVKILVVGITGSIDEEQIKAVSSPPHQLGTTYWTAPDFTSLQSIVNSVQQATCDPPKEILDDCRTIDVCFAIDIPQTATDFVIAKSFIKRFITLYLEVGANAVRLCVITFDGRQATLQIPLNRYYDEENFKMALDEIPFVASGYGDPTYALQLATTTAFSAANGARGANFKPTLVSLLNNGINNRASVINAFNNLHSRGIRSIGIGMTLDISIDEIGLLTYVPSDVISSVSYDQLNSKVQPLSAVLCGNSEYVQCPVVAEICLALDQSTSIQAPPGGYDNWQIHMLGFAKSVASAFPIGPNDTRVGMVGFSTGAHVEFPLYQYTTRTTLLDAINRMDSPGGNTNIAAALRTCRTSIFQYARPGVPLIVILVTDGAANVEVSQTMIEANATKALGATIFTVGITSSIDSNQLRQICTFPPETHNFYASDFSRLSTILNDLIQKSCNTQTTLSGISTTRASTSTTRTSTISTTSSTRMSSTSPTVSSTTSGSTTTTTSPRSVGSSSSVSTTTTRKPSTSANGGVCPSVLDIILILDESTSIVYAQGGYDNWYKYILGFSAELIDSFTIGPTLTQVGVVKFSESAYPAIYMNQYQDKDTLKRVVLSLDIKGGETNIASAFRVTRTTMLTPAHGARANAGRVVFLVTDGVPNREMNFTEPEATLLKADGTRVFAIGVTPMTNAAVLRRLCSEPSDEYFYYVNDYSQLSSLVKRLVATTCNQLPPDIEVTSTTTPRAVVSSSTTTVPPPPTSTSTSTTRTTSTTTRPTTTSTSPSTTTRPITTTTRAPTTTTTSRGVSTAARDLSSPPPDGACSVVADIILILDQSTSIVYADGGYSNWNVQILGFAKDLCKSFVISSSQTQVGAMRFNETYSIDFQLPEHDTNSEVTDALNSLPINGGQTNIALPLRIARTVMFPRGRSNAKKVIVLVTDGVPNREANNTLPEADRCKQDNIEIFTVGITNQTSPIELQTIASLPVSTHYYYVSHYNQLQNILASLSRNMCQSLRG